MNQGSGENHSGSEAFDYEDRLVVEGFALEVAGEEYRRRYADDAGEEDYPDGNELQVRRGSAVAARQGSSRVRHARCHGGS